MVEAAFLEARAEGRDEIRVQHLPESVRTPLRYRRGAKREDNLQAVAVALALSGNRAGEARRLLNVSRATFFNAKAQLARQSGESTSATPSRPVEVRDGTHG